MLSTNDIKGDLLASLLNERALLAVIIVGQLIAITLSFSPLSKDDPWLTLAPVSIFIHMVSLTSLTSLHLLKTQLMIATFRQQLTILVLLICFFTMLFSYGFFIVLMLERLSLIEFLLRNLLISFIVAIIFALFSIIHAERSAAKNQATKDKLSSLQARIRPHFLFNSLNMAAELVYHNAQDAEKTILALAELSRAALKSDEDIELVKELNLAKQYLLVESWRFGERLNVNWQLPSELPDILIPALTIQPLLENAICHGVEVNQGKSEIRINLEITKQSITLLIDNPYIETKQTNRESNGIAVENIRQRLIMKFGNRAGLSHYIRNDIYRTKLVIPR